MSERNRKNTLQVYLSDDEKYILDEKWKLSKMRSRSSFIRHLIIYGFIYDIDYSALTEYSRQPSKIGNNINQIVRRVMKTDNLYAEDIKEIKELMEKVRKKLQWSFFGHAYERRARMCPVHTLESLLSQTLSPPSVAGISSIRESGKVRFSCYQGNP